MSTFNKNEIVLASRQATLKLISQTEAIAKEINLSEKVKNSVEENLSNIKQNTTKLELVLSVVGIMKAGKSTLINSIVGKELLPSRNAAMTVIPTYIKHDSSVSGVNYHFKHAEEFCEFFKKIKNDGYSFSPENNAIAKRLANNNFQLNTNLNCLTQIHDELEVINDLCRIFYKLPEYREYLNKAFKGSEDFPSLTTQFKVIENIESSNDVSHFVVVDTPGANEAKLPILKDIVDKQINRSSALLLVLNYTDLASEADEAMRQRIQEEASSYKDRLIVAVNRFDAKDHKSMKKAETIRYVQEELLEDIELESDFIFPVSARNALLSSQALDWLDEYNKFALDDLKGWQRDFLDNTTSGDWDEDDEDDLEVIEDPKETKRHANKLFKSSKIASFIDTAITRAYQNAGPNTIIASLVKLRDVIEKALIVSLEADIDSSHRTIKELRDRVKQLEEALVALSNLMSETEGKLLDWNNGLTREIDELIKESVNAFDLESPELVKETIENQSPLFKDIFQFLKSSEKTDCNSGCTDEEDFKAKIDKFVAAVEQYVFTQLKESSGKIADELENDVKSFSSYIDNDVLNGVHIRRRELNVEIGFDHNSINKNDHIEIHRQEKKRARKVFGFDISWFPISSIAYETYTEQTKKFNKQSYLDALTNQLKLTFKEHTSQIKAQLQTVADQYGDEIGQLCEIIRHSSQTAIEDEKKESAKEEEREQLFRGQIRELDEVALFSQEIAVGLEVEKERG